MHAGLFALDASPYDHAVATYRVDRDEPLPRLAPGDPVRLELGARGEPYRLLAGDVIVRLSERDDDADGGALRIFAERGDVIAHPDLVGFDPGWRYVAAASADDLAARERRWKRAARSFWLTVAASIGVVGLFVAALLRGPWR